MNYLLEGIIIVFVLSCLIFFYYAAKSYFEYKDAKSSKFREASVSGKVVANDLKACSHPDKVLPPPLPIRSENESRRFIQKLREFNAIDIDFDKPRNKVNIRYGKVGTDGQTSLKELGTPAEAKAHAEKQAAGKVKKGYKEAKVKAAKKAVKKKAAKKVTKKVTKKKAVKKKATKKKAAKKKA